MANKLQHNLALNCLCSLSGPCLLLLCAKKILKKYSLPNILWFLLLLLCLSYAVLPSWKVLPFPLAWLLITALSRANSNITIYHVTIFEVSTMTSIVGLGPLPFVIPIALCTYSYIWYISYCVCILLYKSSIM